VGREKRQQEGLVVKKYIFIVMLIFAGLALWQIPLAYCMQNREAVFTVGQSNYTVEGRVNDMDAVTFMENNRTYVPIRYLAYSIGVTDSGIDWDRIGQTVTLTNDDTKVKMQVGSHDIIIGSSTERMDVAPLLKNGRAYLPARFVAEAFGYEVGWDGATQSVLIGPPGLLPAPPVREWEVKYEQRDVYTSYGYKATNLVFVNMNNRNVELRPVLAQDRVGRNEDLAAMARRVGATAAVNGTYFNAYDENDLMPHGTLEINHRYYHLGSDAAVGIKDSNIVEIGQFTPVVNGSTNGSYVWPNWWYAWAINHAYSDDGIVIFTPAYKDGYTPPGSTCVIVQNGLVTGIESGSAAIPSDGYVIWYGLNNSENSSQFSYGTRVDYQITYKNNLGDFKSSIGNYPLLLDNGAVAVGQVDDQKLTIGAPRSFAGVTRDNIFVMGTVDSANIWELAEVAKNLGLSDALNLDGGASSGLYYNGEYISEPGRLLSNCLAVIVKQ
jgi:hypothetical protein